MFFFVRLIIAGLLVGWMARWFYPGSVPMGWGATVLLGIGGSLFGGLLAGLFSRRGTQPLEPAGCLGSVIGAMLLILIGHKLHLF